MTLLEHPKRRFDGGHKSVADPKLAGVHSEARETNPDGRAFRRGINRENIGERYATGTKLNARRRVNTRTAFLDSELNLVRIVLECLTRDVCIGIQSKQF